MADRLEPADFHDEAVWNEGQVPPLKRLRLEDLRVADLIDSDGDATQVSVSASGDDVCTSGKGAQ